PSRPRTPSTSVSSVLASWSPRTRPTAPTPRTPTPRRARLRARARGSNEAHTTRAPRSLRPGRPCRVRWGPVPRSGPCGWSGGLDADLEGRVGVGAGVRAEGDVRVGVHHTVDLADLRRDERREVFVRRDAHDGDEVDVARARVDLGHALDVRDLLCRLGNPVGCCADEADRGDHTGLLGKRTVMR